MKVEVRLYATFSQFAPSRKAGQPFDVLLVEKASITDLIRHLGIPETNVHLAIVDGRIIHDHSAILSDGSRVGLFPPVGGG